MNHSQDLFEYDVSGIFSENEYVKPLKVYKEFPVKFYFKGKQRIINSINKANSIKKINAGFNSNVIPYLYIIFYKNIHTNITIRSNFSAVQNNAELPYFCIGAYVF
ncbi:hypothetical protein FACS189473_3700 [Spirochaetia bacterium]|nr:hypothetical protein FACS189473_3700 [Spirochaetia bacterium]